MAKREYKKGKASGGMLMEIRKEIMEKGSRNRKRRDDGGKHENGVTKMEDSRSK